MFFGLKKRNSFSRIFSFACSFAVLSIAFPNRYANAGTQDPVSLDIGFHQMYNLDFEAAHKTFEAWQVLHPDDPLGAASNAAAYLFGEFERMHILQLDLFTENKKFDELNKLRP